MLNNEKYEKGCAESWGGGGMRKENEGLIKIRTHVCREKRKYKKKYDSVFPKIKARPCLLYILKNLLTLSV
jgi:hypothetical protein